MTSAETAHRGTDKGQEVIRQVIRGERPWTDLRTVGINIDLQGSHCTIGNPHGLTADADIRDLAHGLLANLHDSSALRTWAFVLEAESLVNWGDAEHQPQWEPLWDAVWSASFGEPVPDGAIKTAEQMLQRKPSNP